MRFLIPSSVAVGLALTLTGCIIESDAGSDADRDAPVKVEIEHSRDVTPNEEGAFERLGARMDKGAKKLDEKLEKSAGKLGQALEKTGRELQEKSAEAQRRRQDTTPEGAPDVNVEIQIDRP